MTWRAAYSGDKDPAACIDLLILKCAKKAEFSIKFQISFF